ncbi:MAG: universal stress protein [Gemmatimonadota bacterium]
MNRLNTILAGVDFGGAGSDAAMWSAMYLDPGRVVLGHVVRPPRAPSFLGLQPDTDEQVEETLLAGARQRVTALADELSEDLGVPFDGIARVGGSVAGALDELAEEVDADLIALGPHDRRKGGWNPLGTIPFRVLHEAKRPTLIARGSISREPRRVLAAIDDSAVSATSSTGWAGPPGSWTRRASCCT